MSAAPRLGLALGYWTAERDDPIELVRLAEDLGYDSVWTGEAYGSDALTPLCWLGARTSRIKLGTNVLQMSARTPTSVAMTAVTLDHLSEGRLILGLGLSGPQVVEGWYGQPFARPLERTRSYLEVIRAALGRERPLTHPGPHHPLPYEGPGALGMGKPLKMIVHPRRARMPIYLAAGGQRNVALAAEIADGWLPSFYSPHREHLYDDALRAAPPGFEIAVTVTVIVDEDVQRALRAVKERLAFYIGGMGATTQNFHLDQIARLGYRADALEAQRLFLAGDRAAAVDRLPDALADEIALVGPPGRIRDRLPPWLDSRATTLIVSTRDPAALSLVADEVARHESGLTGMVR